MGMDTARSPLSTSAPVVTKSQVCFLESEDFRALRGPVKFVPLKILTFQNMSIHALRLTLDPGASQTRLSWAGGLARERCLAEL